LPQKLQYIIIPRKKEIRKFLQEKFQQNEDLLFSDKLLIKPEIVFAIN